MRWALQWLVLLTVVAVVAGTSSWALLLSLDWATALHVAYPKLIWGLPLGGFAVGLAYFYWSKKFDRANPAEVVPLRGAPLIWGATGVTHLFGGSAGREGTAVQMSLALSDWLKRPFALGAEASQALRMAAVSAGFAAVFGTPFAGLVFGMEATLSGAKEATLSGAKEATLSGAKIAQLSVSAKARLARVLSCLVASQLAHRVALFLGAHHTHYELGAMPGPSFMLCGSVLAIGAASGLVARIFVYGTHAVTRVSERCIRYEPLRPAIGGFGVALLMVTLALHMDGGERYRGLGVSVIVEAFQHPSFAWDFALKAALTALTVGTGFKGGEATPLFFIGATLGSFLSTILSLPTGLSAGLGFVAVFAGAASTPWTTTLMAMELFGAKMGLYALLVSFVSRLISGRQGIYSR